MRTLTASDIRRLRLTHHWLAPRPDADALAVVTHLGALQSQEIWSGMWSIGSRSGSLDVQAIDQACEQAQILRTWPLRNTVHFIPAADAHWMLQVARSFAFKGVEKRRAFIGLTEAQARSACDVLAEKLPAAAPVLRDECLELMAEAGVLDDKRHAYHLVWFAAQHGVVAIGPQRGTAQTLVKLDTWVTGRRELSGEAALGELAVRYFTSHGPSPLGELRRWSGLTMAEVRRGVAAAGETLCEVPTDFGPMLVDADQAAQLDAKPVDHPDPDRRVLLLSGFDEYVLGYGDRSAILDEGRLADVVPGNNGMFRPTIVDDGKIIGTWKRKVTTKRVDIITEPFDRLTKPQVTGLARAAEEYGKFLGLEPRVVT